MPQIESFWFKVFWHVTLQNLSFFANDPSLTNQKNMKELQKNFVFCWELILCSLYEIFTDIYYILANIILVYMDYILKLLGTQGTSIK